MFKAGVRRLVGHHDGRPVTKIRASVLEHRRFWDALHVVTQTHLVEIERRVTQAMIEQFRLDVSAVALDMTNFATYIDTGNDKADLAQRGKAKQKRSDLRLVGLGLVVTRDGGIPLVSHTCSGNRPDVTQFATVLDELCHRYRAVTDEALGEVTVVFDAGQNSTANFEHLRATGIGYVTSLPPSDHPDLTVAPKRRRRAVDAERFAGLTALQTRKDIYGQPTRVILTHSPTLHAGQSRGFDQTLAKTEAKLAELAARCNAVKPAAPATPSPPTSPPYAKTPGSARYSSGNSPVTPPRRCACPGESTRRPAPRWKPNCSASESWSPTGTPGPSATSWPPTAPNPTPSSGSVNSKTQQSCRSHPCTTGPTRASACTSTPASSPCRSPTSCAARQPTPA
ncbi:MAG: Transposase [Dactylosporangium sp.]|nr:Transposase [Dactylosporangium sp.]